VFALSLGVDFVALSFVQRPEDVVQLKELLEKNIKRDEKNPTRIPRIPKIIAKVISTLLLPSSCPLRAYRLAD
jgi:pyruvate kinase